MNVTAPNPPACDCHFHVFGANTGISDARYRPAYSAPSEEWAVLARTSGVERGVVVQPSFLGTDNTQLLEALHREPQSLRGVAVVASTIGADELAQLHEAGVRGVRLNLFNVDDDFVAVRSMPSSYWSAVLAADMHLELHATCGRVAALLPLLPPELTVVLDHFAKPEAIAAADATVRAVRQRRQSGGTTYVTLSGAYRQADPVRHRCAELAALWRDELGPTRLLWGSDWPCTNFEAMAQYAALRDDLVRWLGDQSDLHAALAENPQRLYWR